MFNKLHIQGLSLNTTDDTLGQAFSEFGQVVDVTVVKVPRVLDMLHSVVPLKPDAADSGMHEQELDGGRMKIRFAEDDDM